MTPARPLSLRLDASALVDNWRALAKLSGRAATGAAVKADGYGLGAREVVRRLANAGCRDFFVAHWAEAAQLTDIIPASQIAVLNGITAEDIAQARHIGAVPVLNTPRQIADWKASGGGRCHVMLDSGINRLGMGPEQIDASLFEGMQIDILASHLASADEDVPQNAQQLELFLSMATNIKASRRSLANSAGIMLGANYHFDLTRPGLSLYGGIARPEMADIIKPVVQIEAVVLQVRELGQGASVGYNATYICPKPMRVATVAIGYADGYLRSFSGKGMAVFDGIKMPLIGRVSMDLVTVDVSDASEVQEGARVDISYDLVEAAEQSGLSQYELLTGLSDRFERHWF
ncbi:MAG: alanine racemase [Sphingorhabdus sp.]